MPVGERKRRMKIGDTIDGTGFGCGGAGLLIACWKDEVASVARLEHGGYYWRLTTKPRDAGCGATSFTLLAEGWAQEWGAALAAVHGVARHLEITLDGPVSSDSPAAGAQRGTD